MTLKDKKIIIVGASSGMGLATAKHLYKKGANIIMVARNEKRLIDSTQSHPLTLTTKCLKKRWTFTTMKEDIVH